MKYLVPLGRVLYVYIFIHAAPGHFTEKTIGYAASHGVPMASLLVPISGAMCLAGGLSILFGFKARWGAWLIVGFLVPVTLTMHNFWAVTDPAMAQMQYINFMKNMSMLGCALMLTHFGVGPLSLDAWLSARSQNARPALEKGEDNP